jgi:hypothetical protein
MLIEKVEDITVATLNVMLKDAGFKSVIKVDVVIIDYESPTSELRRVVLQYDESTVGLNPKTLMIKYARVLPAGHWINTLLVVDRTLLREVNSYRYL